MSARTVRAPRALHFKAHSPLRRIACLCALSLAASVLAASAMPPASNPATRPSPAPSSLAEVPPADVTDAQVGLAIERGVSFVLSQFKDGQIIADPNLSDSQNQGLDALCVYALLQSGQAIRDSRLLPQGSPMRQILARLDGFELTSDGQVSNRPITYGRSLRAAALATYNRPEDRNILKSDVAWLLGAQIDGAYSYDDIYRRLMKEGLKPSGDAVSPRGSVFSPAGTDGPRPDFHSASVRDEAWPYLLQDDFGGGSAPPSFNPGPYPSGSSSAPAGPSMPLSPRAPGAGRSGGGGGQQVVHSGPSRPYYDWSFAKR